MDDDIDDTTRCPLGEHCAVCGTTTSLAVATYQAFPGGVVCATVCDQCQLPPLGVVEAATRVAEHCEHLGIDVDRESSTSDSELSFQNVRTYVRSD